MPIYPVKNNKTGEEQTLNMTIANYEQWRKDNPDWDKDWSKDVHLLRKLEIGRIN